ncbi:MAG TPA: response regulator transcription factor [Prolixibacteraceae bacterium]|nr:response regulator transcription factor [Prolixibacteraceae bacterium]HPR59655.1 response regulator transcription factor [Prolixibacteraceae bacterium]
MNNSVFFVEDDLSFGSVMKSYLEINGYEVVWVNDGKHAVERFQEGVFNLAILDVMLPNVDGFSIGKSIRQINNDIPLIYLTAKALKEDILQGYDIGADDYITKPFDSEVLLRKIEAILKRSENSVQKKEHETYAIGIYTFDFKHRLLLNNDQKERLSPKEAGLLRLLCLNTNELLPREQALKALWGDDDYFTARSMDVYITKLRKYLAADKNIEIKNIHSSGFILEINE